MRIGFAFTNYNNSALSIQAAQSIAAHCGDCEYAIALVDNDSAQQERRILAESGALPANCAVIWNERNVGYFDGLNIGVTALKKINEHYDAIVIGNNDLVFGQEFFSGLKAVGSLLADYSVISPDILTLDNVHQNPHVHSSVSRFREIVWDLYFSNYTISRVISWCARLAGSWAARNDLSYHEVEGPIAQGYGACYILTPRFFEKYGSLWSPGFVMGEEFYLQRQLHAGCEQTYYSPMIKVHHHDHATIAKIPTRKLWDMTRQYHRIYRFFVSPYRVHMDNGKTPADYDRHRASC